MKIDSSYLTALALAAEIGRLPSIENFTAFVNSGKLELFPELPETFTLYEFTVPTDATIDSAKEGLPIRPSCITALSEADFGGTKFTGTLRGGFVPNNDDSGVDLFFKIMKNGFRLGTALEFLLFKKQNHPHPEFCVALGTISKGSVLDWYTYGSVSEFALNQLTGSFPPLGQVFIVKEVEPSALLKS